MEKFDGKFSSFDTIRDRQTDRQTDGRTDRERTTTKTALCIASHGKIVGKQLWVYFAESLPSFWLSQSSN